jgi:putative membrane-bound dehydrogenase-like protein
MARLFLILVGFAFGPSLFAANPEIEGERKEAQTVCPTPEEARKKMSVPEGYEVRCFAHEPMVQNPVAMTWDHRGRLWVVEAYEYPEGSPHPAPFGGEVKDDGYQAMPKVEGKVPRDRVIILEDTDNDGEADKRTVFVEGLNLASAILCGDDGIYVGQQPHLIHFKDADGDDKPEAWRVVLTGFGREDTHELVNSFTWGPDGWLYMTHGVFTNSKVRSPGKPESEGFKFDAGIGRARPKSREKEAEWEFEVFADGTSNPWGCDYDAAGNFFVSACVIDHFFHMAPGGIYVRQGGAPENPYAYELLPSIVKHKHFRAAYAGIQIYQGGRYPADTHGHAFIGNIHDNAIHEEVLTPVGATFKCEPRRDFLRANDGWFRPVSTQTGPDGFLWVMDWCDKYPCYQNAKANPEGVDRERGRIWRVVYKAPETNYDPFGFQYSAVDTSRATPSTEVVLTESRVEQPVFKVRDKAAQSRPAKDMDLAKLDAPALVKLLEHPNSWMRRKARRGLSEQHAEDTRETLLQIAKSDAPVSARLEAIWTLSAINPQDYRAIEWLAKNDPNPALKAWAARLFGEGGHVGHYWLDELAENPDPSVRLAVSIALRQKREVHLTSDRARPSLDSMGRSNGPTILETKLLTAGVHPEDKVLPLAIWMVIEPVLADIAKPWLDWLAGIAPTTQNLSRILSHKAMRRLCDTRKAENLDLAVGYCDKIAAHDILLAHALDGLVKGQEGGVIKPGKDVSASLAKWRASENAEVRKGAQTLAVLWGDEVAVREMIGSLVDEKKTEAERVAVLQSLRMVKTDLVREGVKPLLKESTPVALAVAAIRAVADLGGDGFVEPLVGLAASKVIDVRLAALEALGGRGDWTRAMLDAIAKGTVSASGFPVPVRRALATGKDQAIRDQAFKVLGAWKDSSEDVKSLIGLKKAAVLTGEPDLANGRLMFTVTCMVCHEFHGGGQKVGPDLIGSGRSNLDALLANVIDPNQIIGNGYENFMLSTKDGRTLAGRVVEDTPGHVKLMGAGGAAQVVARDQIASLTNTKQSLMPMGFGNLPDAAFRDLIWYVLAPPEEGPLTEEKKQRLIHGVEGEDAKKPTKPNWRAIDWESVSLWNPAWKVSAPDFERTPVKRAEYHGKTNVLVMHPFADKTTPASFERVWKVEAGKTRLAVDVAADDRGDWVMKAVVNGKVVKEVAVDAEKPRWKRVEVDLKEFEGQEVTVRLEAHASGWNWEFAYWHGIVVE